MYTTIEPRLIALLNETSFDNRVGSSVSLPPLQDGTRVSRRPSPLEPDNNHSSRQPLTRQTSLSDYVDFEKLGPPGSEEAIIGRQSIQKILVGDDFEYKQESSKKRRRLDNTKDEFVQLPQPALKKPSTAKQVVPPIIIGLFEPPPNAALFPPIASSSFHDSHGRNSLNAAPIARKSPSKVSEQRTEIPKETKDQGEGDRGTKKSQIRRKWSEEETNQLLLGVHKHGVSKWKTILKDPEFTFNNRNAVDLKDRFRTCCPEELRTKLFKTGELHGSLSTCRAVPDKQQQLSRCMLRAAALEQSDLAMEVNTTDLRSTASQAAAIEHGGEPTKRRTRQSKAHRKDMSDLLKLGIQEPFKKSERRERRPFTEEEDRDILRGWECYGQAWTRIMSDPKFKLQHRRPTDLRDRFRNRFPEKYTETTTRNPQLAKNNAVPHSKDLSTDPQGTPFSSNIQIADVAKPVLLTLNRGLGPISDFSSSIESSMEGPPGTFSYTQALEWNDSGMPSFNAAAGEMDISRLLLDDSWGPVATPNDVTKQRPSYTDINSICASAADITMSQSASFDSMTTYDPNRMHLPLSQDGIDVSSNFP
jgi:hypothetical protein